MLTIDDINSIFEKYGKVGFWYEVDLTKFPTTDDKTINYDFFTVSKSGSTFYISFHDGLFEGVHYLTQNGNISMNTMVINLSGSWELRRGDDKLHLFIQKQDISTGIDGRFYATFHMIIPMSNLVVPIINGAFDDKFYINSIGTKIKRYLINNRTATLETDDKGTFLRLPSAEDCSVGVEAVDREIYTWKYFYYEVHFQEFKTLPILSIPSIYKGNTQTIQLFNDTEEITEFQAYYKGELLTDNKITLPYDADDYIDITVDLLDNRYPNSTLKLKAPTQMYIANSQSDVVSAISQGITTLQVGDTETEVLLNGIDLTQVTLVTSNIQLTNSTLNNCTILNSQYTDNGANTITNTVIRNTDYTSTSKSVYENTSFYNSSIQDSELQITGTIYECELTNSLIISDGTININNNTFTGVGSKEYFPSHLYLTGDYIVSGNTFNLTGTFTELQFNMCLIKATNDFNVGEFINKNTFQLNIEYGTENPSTLYYNIVDDDKIRARRV